LSDRWEKRKYRQETKTIVKKAKQDMAEWLSEINRIPNELEITAWQSGYVAGINRGAGNRDKNDN